MTDSYDSLARRDFFKALGAAAVPLLVAGCDPEPTPQSFRAGPSSKPRTSSVEVGRALLEQLLISDNQRCSLPAKFANLAGIGQQVRISRPDGGAALYTVDELRKDDNPDYARMNLSARLRIGTSNVFAGTVSNTITASHLSDGEAEDRSEFVERLVDDGHSTSLIAVAAHGGAIETKTDDQAEYLTSALADYGASSWICKGWQEGGGAFDRWHIRSTDLDPRSFRGLAKVADRGFAYCVSFHGMDVSGGVLIGGGGPLWLKQQLASAIQSAIGKTLGVGIATSSDVYDGDRDDNIVNWITAGGHGGIQIEQSRTARVDRWEAIAAAIAKVFKTVL